MKHLLNLSSVLDETQIKDIKQQVTYSIMNNLNSLKNHQFKFKPKDIVPDKMHIHVMIETEIKKPVVRITSENIHRRIFEDLVGFTL